MEIEMKIKEGFVVRKVMGNHVVIALGEASRNFHGMVKLNDTAAEIWGYISEGKNEEEIISDMLEKYDVGEEKLREDVEKIINTFKEQGFVEI